MRSIRYLGSLWLTVSLAAPLFGQGQAPVIEFESFTLSNGMKAPRARPRSTLARRHLTWC